MCITQFISHIVIHSNLFTVTDLDMVIFVFPAIGSRFFFSFFLFFFNKFPYRRSRICTGNQSKFDANWSSNFTAVCWSACFMLIYSYTPLDPHVTIIKYQWKIIAIINSIASRIIKSIIGIVIVVIITIK